MLLETVLKCTVVCDISIAGNPEVQSYKGQWAISIYSLPPTSNPFPCIEKKATYLLPPQLLAPLK